MIQTDILIIGAGPCGLFTVFEAGLLKLRCHLIDALPQPGGQCAEIYPKKPIYDIPAYPSILAGDLVDQLMEQAEPFKPGFTLGERAETIVKDDEDQFIVTTNRGTVHCAPIIAIAGVDGRRGCRCSQHSTARRGESGGAAEGTPRAAEAR